MRYAVWMMAAVFAAACETPFSSEQEITVLRVLGIRSDPVRLSDDAPLTLSALWATPPDGPIPKRTVWIFCKEFVSPDWNDATACTPIIEPEVQDIKGNLLQVTLDVPSLADTLTPEALPMGGTAVLMLICDGAIDPLPKKRIDVRRLHTYCRSEAHTMAVKWIKAAVPDDETPDNPIIVSLALNGEVLPDDVEIETELTCETRSCLETVTVEAEIDEATYEGFTDDEVRSFVRWYATPPSVVDDSVGVRSPNTVAAEWTLDGPGRHDLFFVVQESPEGTAFRHIAVALQRE